jgi:FMN-dependent NADH-azoreductase
MLLLQFLENTASQGSKGLEGGPVELLLLTQGGILANQPVVFPIETLAIRTLAGFFGHRLVSADQPPSWH